VLVAAHQGLEPLEVESAGKRGMSRQEYDRISNFSGACHKIWAKILVSEKSGQPNIRKKW
jgi:hypothetical protein